MRKDLGYAHMGARINEKLQEAINVTRGEVAPPPKPKTSPATRKKPPPKNRKPKPLVNDLHLLIAVNALVEWYEEKESMGISKDAQITHDADTQEISN